MRFKLTKRKKRDLAKKAIQYANRNICKDKRKYTDVGDAWEWAEYYYIRGGVISTPYQCVGTNHYHLTKKATIGNLSHIPEEYRELFATVDQEEEDCFWRRLQEFIGIK